jgi:glycogen debranching enzyme
LRKRCIASARVLGVTEQPAAASGAVRRRRTVSRRRDPFFVRSIADAVVLKDRDLFMVTDRSGNVPGSVGHGFGLYLHDCRFLSTLQLSVAGVGFEPRATDDSRGNVARIELGNDVDIGLSGGEVLARQKLLVRLQRTLDGARRTVFDDLWFRNRSPERLRTPIRLAFSSAFEDIFEVRGLIHARGGRHHAPTWEGDRVRLTYEGRDGFVRTTWLQFRPAPSRTDEGGAEWDLSLAAGESFELQWCTTAVESPTVPTAPPPGIAPKRPRRAERDRPPPPTPWLEDQVGVRTGSPIFERIVERSFADLRMLVSTNGREEYFAAGVPWFVALFGRDSLIAALEVLPYDPSIAAATLRLLAARQGTVHDAYREEAPGRILHELRLGEYAHQGLIPHTPYYGSIDATPLWLCLLGAYSQWTGDLELFRELRPHVEAALAWIEGAVDADGFLGYDSGGHGKLVNQGWKDSGDGIVDVDGSLGRPPIRLVEVQGYVYEAYRQMAELFARDGDTGRARRLRSAAARLRRAFDEHFWLADRAHLALGLQDGPAPLRTLTSNAGQALWSGIVTAERARLTGRAMTGRSMFNGWGIRTLADRESRYDPLSYHLGSVWPHDNALIVAGLRRYGLDAEAEQVFTGLFEAAIEFPGHRLPELFAGFSRAEFESPVPYPVACHPQAWAAGAIPSLLATMLGLQPQGFDRRLVVRRPRLPSWLPSVELNGLAVGGARANLRFVRDGGGATRLEIPGKTDLEVQQVG